jgi:hypothetical protein
VPRSAWACQQLAVVPRVCPVWVCCPTC